MVEESYQQILAIGRYHAGRQHLQRADAWDCAMELLHSLRNEASNIAPQPQIEADLSSPIVDRDALMRLHRRAAQHAYNFVWRKNDLARHLAAGDAAIDLELRSLPDSALTPIEQLNRLEILTILLTALQTFSLQERETFLAYHLHERSLGEIADTLHTTIQIIKQRLYRTRKQLRECLEAAGWNEDALRSFLVPDHHL